MATKKDVDKISSKDVPTGVSEGTAEDNKDKKEEQEVLRQEIEEGYILPDIPPTPLSGTVYHSFTFEFLQASEGKGLGGHAETPHL